MASSSEDITVEAAPTTINPYEVLSLPKSATADEVKSAYRRAALKNHPDKVPESEKEAAHAKFQDVALAYAVLSDPRRRARYDATGRTEDSLDLDDDDEFDWATFFRTQFAEVVTAERIAGFAKEYKGSEEEREHLLASYTKGEGRMGRIYQEVMLSDVLQDEERFRAIIDQAIKDGEVQDYKKYSQESERSRNARFKEARKIKERESAEAIEALATLEKENQKNGTKATKEKKAEKGNADADLGGLAAMIQKRQQSRAGAASNFFDNLEAKYAPKGKKGSKRAAEDEPPEEAFAKNRAARSDHSKGKSLAEEATGNESNGSRKSKSKRNKK